MALDEAKSWKGQGYSVIVLLGNHNGLWRQRYCTTKSKKLLLTRDVGQQVPIWSPKTLQTWMKLKMLAVSWVTPFWRWPIWWGEWSSEKFKVLVYTKLRKNFADKREFTYQSSYLLGKKAASKSFESNSVIIISTILLGKSMVIQLRILYF